jgi:8-oxo-dGTP pyrophosphatase MutT (NUDIX family)
MEIIATITEADVYKEREPTPKESYGPLRKTSRVALFDEHNNVALHYYSTNGGYFMIGGGVEDGESIEDALIREVKEEVGCKIKNVKELGIIIEHGVGKEIKHTQENYCFIAEVDGENGTPQFTEQEIAWGIQLVWFKMDEAIEKIKLLKDNFGKARTLILLEKAKEFLDNAMNTETTSQYSHVGVYGIYIKNNAVLMIKKSRGPYKGMYDLPGGRMEEGETMEEGLQREFVEEVGCELTSQTFLSENEYTTPYYMGKPFHHLGTYFTVSLSSEDIKTVADGEDSLGAEFVSLDVLDNVEISPIAKPMILKALALL